MIVCPYNKHNLCIFHLTMLCSFVLVKSLGSGVKLLQSFLCDLDKLRLSFKEGGDNTFFIGLLWWLNEELLIKPLEMAPHACPFYFPLRIFNSLDMKLFWCEWILDSVYVNRTKTYLSADRILELCSWSKYCNSRKKLAVYSKKNFSSVMSSLCWWNLWLGK